MINLANCIIVLKYAACIALIAGIMFAPAWLAIVAGRKKYDLWQIRAISFVFSWTIIGWLWALFAATKK